MAAENYLYDEVLQFRLIAASQTYIVREPGNWADINVILKRGDEHGMNYQFSDGKKSLEFDYAAGKEYIQDAYNHFGTDAICVLQFGRLTSTAFEVLYQGNLNLNEAVFRSHSISCPVERISFEDRLRTRFDTKVQLNASETLDGDSITPLTPHTALLHSKVIRETSRWTINAGLNTVNKDSTGIQYDNGTYAIPAHGPPWQVETGEIETTQQPYSYKDEDATIMYTGQDYPFAKRYRKFRAQGRLKFHVNIFNEGDYGSTGGQDVYLDIVYHVPGNYNAPGGPGMIDIGFQTRLASAADILANRDFDLTFDETFEVFENANLHFVTSLIDGVLDPEDIEIVYDTDDSWLEITEDTENPPSECKGYLIHEAFEQTIKIITGASDPFYSRYFGRVALNYPTNGCGSNNFITNGYQIRQFEVDDRPVEVSLEELWKAMHARYALGMQIIKPEPSIEALNPQLVYTTMNLYIQVSPQSGTYYAPDSMELYFDQGNSSESELETFLQQVEGDQFTVENHPHEFINGTWTIDKIEDKREESFDLLLVVYVKEPVEVDSGSDPGDVIILRRENTDPVPNGSIRIEPIEEFYNNNKIHTFEEVGDYEREISQDHLFNTVEIGYEEYPDDVVDKLDEFCTEHQYLLPIRSYKETFRQLSPMITSGYTIEQVRRKQYSDNPQESTAEDDKLFLISMVQKSPTIIQASWYIYDIPDATHVTIIGDEQDVNYIKSIAESPFRCEIIESQNNNGTYNYNLPYVDGEGLITFELSSGTISDTGDTTGTFRLYKNYQQAWHPEQLEFFDVTDVIRPDTAYNVRHSPKNMMYRWRKWINSVLYFKREGVDVIRNTFAKKNKKMTSQHNSESQCTLGNPDKLQLTEGADIPLTDYYFTEKLFKPEIIRFKTPFNFDLIKELKAEFDDFNLGYVELPFGEFIEYTDQNNQEYWRWKENNPLDPIKGYILEISFKPAQPLAEVKMLAYASR